MHIAVRTTIKLPRQVVWGHIVDPAKHLGFMEGMSRWEPENAGPTGLGSRIAMRLRVGSVELGGRIEVIEFAPPADLAWTSITGVAHRGRWRLRPRTGGGTDVELRVVYHSPGRLVAFIANLAAAPMVMRQLRRSLARLKAQLEAPPSRPPRAVRSDHLGTQRMRPGTAGRRATTRRRARR